MPLRIVFMGTPDFAVPTLAEIVGAGHEVVAVYSQPPRAAGRGMAERKSPVQPFAEAAGIPVLTPASFKDEADKAAFAAHAADAAVVVAYGLLLPAAGARSAALRLLQPARLEAAALARRRAHPARRSWPATRETAVMVMRMEQGLDTGPVCLGEQVPSAPTRRRASCTTCWRSAAPRSWCARWRRWSAARSIARRKPAEGVTYAKKIDKAEARIDFAAGAHEVHNLIRGLSPFPGAWFEAGTEGKRERIKVLRATVVDRRGDAGHGARRRS